MMSPTYGGGGSAKRWRYSISLFSKTGDKGEGGVKNLKKWVTSFMDSPKGKIKSSKESTSLSEKPTTKIVPGLNWVNQSLLKLKAVLIMTMNVEFVLVIT